MARVHCVLNQVIILIRKKNVAELSSDTQNRRQLRSHCWGAHSLGDTTGSAVCFLPWLDQQKYGLHSCETGP